MKRLLKLSIYVVGTLSAIIAAIIIWLSLTWPPLSNENKFIEFIRDGNIHVVKEMIRSGADLNKPGKWRGMMANAKWTDGRTPLTQAAQANRIKIAEYLLSEGADINIHDGYGQAPVHVAAQYGHYDMVYLLIKNQCNINLMQSGNNNYHSALSNAIIKRDKEIVRLLLENGAILNNPDFIIKDIVEFIYASHDQSLISLLDNTNKSSKSRAASKSSVP